MMKNELKSEELYRIHWALLFGGLAVGLLAAFLLSAVPFDFSADLVEAKRLGIVSKTTLAGYQKKRDILNYALIILLPVAAALLPWMIWSRSQRSSLAAMLAHDKPEFPFPAKSVHALIIFVAVLLLTFNVNNLLGPTGGWGFLGEEGQFLADAQILLGGGKYARDFLCLYGPLAVYPLAWVMKIFGASVLAGRLYTYTLGVFSSVILLGVIYHGVKRRTVFIAASFVCLLAFASGGGRTGGTSLRVLLGILPLLLLYRFRGNPKTTALASGLALGASLMFSQEVGLCALIATAAYLALEGQSDGFRASSIRGGILVLGAAAVVVPILVYFQSVGALAPFFDSLYGYPKLVTLGFGSLPFPSPTQLLADPFGTPYFPYWIIGVYLCCATSYLVRLIITGGNHEIHFKSAILIFGLLLFRAALGRADESHFFFVAPPAFILAFFIMDEAVRGRTGMLRPPGGARSVVVVVSLSLLLLCVTSRVLRENGTALASELIHFPQKFSVLLSGVNLPDLPRGKVVFDRETARDVVAIQKELKRFTREGEPVLFFPNEAAYYFLFNRPCPTRFVHAYFAISSDYRRQMVAQLEQSRPSVVIYTLDNWRMDDILEDVAVPEVVRYLKEKYVVAEDLGNILVLRRKGMTNGEVARVSRN